MNEQRRAAVDHNLWDLGALVLAVSAAYAFGDTAVGFRRYLNDDPGAVYGPLVGLHGALLGFVLAAFTIALGYAQSERFTIVRNSGQLPNLYRIFFANIVTEGLCLITALAALLIQGSSLVNTGLAFAVFATALLAALRFGRTLWVTNAITIALSTDPLRAPGQQ
jgi:hypothetical protein